MADILKCQQCNHMLIESEAVAHIRAIQIACPRCGCLNDYGKVELGKFTRSSVLIESVYQELKDRIQSVFKWLSNGTFGQVCTNCYGEGVLIMRRGRAICSECYSVTFEVDLPK